MHPLVRHATANSHPDRYADASSGQRDSAAHTAAHPDGDRLSHPDADPAGL
ncbi:MAG: hypothetical protein JOZ41_11160 [Chloroflexi bacterium]|nr:hypothetical protein [Chloroflexota bacterium]